MLLRKHLNKKQLVDLGIEVAYKKGLKPLTNNEIEWYWGTRNIAVRVNQSGMLMIDREFIRFEDDNDNVTYVYITQHHIDEVRKAARRAGSFTRIPTEIEVAFYAAEDAMQKAGKSYWINPEYENRADAEEFEVEI